MHLVIKNRKDYFKLFQIISEESQIEFVNIHLYLQFLNPSDILMLTEFIIIQLQRVKKVDLTVHNPNVKKYLEAIGIFEFCTKNYSGSTEIKEISSYTAMPIRRVNQENMNYYIDQTQKYFQRYCHNKDLGVLNIALSELINNVYDHSKSFVDSLVFSQFYPGSNEIKIAVSDLGLGIPKTVNKYFSEKGKNQVSQEEGIRWALKINKTTESMPHNAGRGLDTVASFVQANKGSWELLSDQIRMQGNKKENIFTKNPIDYFIGTVIEITIKVTNLEEQELINEIDWDF
ncbi:hypothetical protein [Aquiflexum lacus]|uniref:hypothetical protein n=1 Tax=Aquiflexum lacus TaxID=2483805 RepID=UPI0018935DEF|nr:hypothetical protein [Aquiflexum lacus]